MWRRTCRAAPNTMPAPSLAFSFFAFLPIPCEQRYQGLTDLKFDV